MEVDQWGFTLTWQGRERASSICVRSSEQAEIARNYVESMTERQCVGEGVNRCEGDIEGGGGGGGEDEDGR